MAYIKQMLWPLAVLLLAAGLLAGMVVYTVAVMRSAQIQIITGEISASCWGSPSEQWSRLHFADGFFALFVRKTPFLGKIPVVKYKNMQYNITVM